MKYLKRILGILWLCSGFFITVAVAAEPQPQRAPVSARFAQYVNRSEVSKSAVKPVDSVAAGVAKSTGYIPSPLDYSHLRGKSSQIVRHSSALKQAYALLPYELYDLRAEGRVTPVRNQGSCGACWTFGTLASLESALLPMETADFSENNLKNSSGFDFPICYGGNADMAVAYLSRWSGPVAEADDPYSVKLSSVSPPGLLPRKHVQEVLIIPGRGTFLDNDDNDGIKQALMDYGAITTSIYVDGGATGNKDSDYYKPATSSYYYDGVEESNHIVAIVGWNDTYSADNFSTRPPGDGAFIVKNSWGTSWGDGGYFYISYHDSVVGGDLYVFNSAMNPDLYSNIYQYDPLGLTGTAGYGSSIGWFANIFTAITSEKLAAVSFHTNDIKAKYEVYIYKGVTEGAPRSGVLVLSSDTFSGTIPYPGYHTLPVPTPVSLVGGERFSVVVKITNLTYQFPIPLEEPIVDYASKAAASAGQSFMSYEDGTLWTDVATKYQNTNVALKAFTNPAYSVTYNDNTSTGGAVPVDSNSYLSGASVTVLGNSGALIKSGYSFAGWNTLADGTGTAYAVGSTFSIVGNMVLYAQWTPLPTYTVTYSGNGNTGGIAPVDGSSPYYSGSTVIVSGAMTLTKTNYLFVGWNTQADGSGITYPAASTFTIGSANVTLYAIYAAAKPGDCETDGIVTIAEVQSAINMFLGLKTVAVCVDQDNNESVSIAEVQRVINSFLGISSTSGSSVAKSTLARETAPNVADADLATVVSGNTDFALKMFPLLDVNPAHNTFFSPYSTTQAFALLAPGVRGATASQIEQTLSFNIPQARLNPAFNKLGLILESRTSGIVLANGLQTPKLTNANALWGQHGFSILPAYLDTLAVNFDAGLHFADFVAATESSRQSINGWVEGQTNGKILNLIPQGGVTADTRLVLTNALWFKASWASPFIKDSTANQSFINRDSTSSVHPFMRQRLSLPFAETAEYRAVDIPYAGDNLSMLVIMPGPGTFDLFTAGLTPSVLTDITNRTNRLSARMIDFSMPKFTFTKTSSLTQNLKSLGMTDAFDPNRADLSGIDGQRDLFVTDVFHQAFIGVDEEGTEAAAATAISVGTTSIPVPDLTLAIDHPFIFLIRDRQSGSILFMGKIVSL